MSNIKRYIGLSLSFCVKDILNGKINIDEVSAIVTSTAFKSVEECIKMYYMGYWEQYTKSQVREVLTNLWPIIFQPRLSGDITEHRGHMLSHGWWVDTFEGTVFKRK